MEWQKDKVGPSWKDVRTRMGDIKARWGGFIVVVMTHDTGRDGRAGMTWYVRWGPELAHVVDGWLRGASAQWPCRNHPTVPSLLLSLLDGLDGQITREDQLRRMQGRPALGATKSGDWEEALIAAQQAP